MSYDPNVPNFNTSPGLFPSKCNTNFARLQTIVNADHMFNDSAAATDGIHKQVTLLTRDAPGALAVGDGILYTKLVTGVSQLYFYNGTTDMAVTPAVSVGATVKACVNFDGTSAVGAQSMRSQFNVSSVMKTDDGTYTINFATPLTDDAYIVLLCGMRGDSGSKPVFGFVESSPTYATAVTREFVKIQFTGETDFRDVLMGNVIIYNAV